SGDFAIRSTRTGYQLTGPAGKAVWDWSNQAAERLRLGLVRQLEPVQALNAYGGALSLAALLLHGVNLLALRSRDELREHDAVRGAEHSSTWLNIVAAMSAVVQNASHAGGLIEKSFFGARLPLVTLLGTVTGPLRLWLERLILLNSPLNRESKTLIGRKTNGGVWPEAWARRPSQRHTRVWGGMPPICMRLGAGMQRVQPPGLCEPQVS